MVNEFCVNSFNSIDSRLNDSNDYNFYKILLTIIF